MIHYNQIIKSGTLSLLGKVPLFVLIVFLFPRPYHSADLVKGRRAQLARVSRYRHSCTGACKPHKLVVAHALRKGVDTARLEGVACSESACGLYPEGREGLCGISPPAVEQISGAVGYYRQAVGVPGEKRKVSLPVGLAVVHLERLARDHRHSRVSVNVAVILAVYDHIGLPVLYAQLRTAPRVLPEAVVNSGSIAHENIALTGLVPVLLSAALSLAEEMSEAPQGSAHVSRDQYVVLQPLKVLVKGEGAEINALVFVEFPRQLRSAPADVGAVYPDRRPERGEDRGAGACLTADEPCALLYLRVFVGCGEVLDLKAVRAADHSVKIDVHALSFRFIGCRITVFSLSGDTFRASERYISW